jgi:tetratricopeptide (TPR) repeat protein
VRLVPNRPGIQFQGRIRESLLPSLDSLGLTVDGLPWRISRGARGDDPDDRRRQARRDLRIADLEMAQLGPVARLLCCKGDALQALDDGQEAAKCFSQAIEVAPPGSPEMLEAYYGLLTALDEADQTREKQLSVCLEALETFPVDAQLLCAMGGYLQTQGRIDLACRAYQTAYQHGEVDPQTWHLDEINDIAAVCYSLSLQLQNNDELALRSLEEALDANPDSDRIRRQLTELYIKQRRREKAIDTADRLPQPEALRDSLHSAIRGACLASQNNWPAAKAYLKAAYRAGCRDPICLRWYTMTLLTVGDSEEASTVIDEWRRIDPANIEMHRYLEKAATRLHDKAAAAGDVRVDPAATTSSDPAALTRAITGSPATPLDLSGPPASA